MGHFPASGPNFGNSEVLTSDVCCGKNMSSPEFRRSQVLSMGSVLNILSDVTQIFLGTSGNQPFSQKIPFFETNFTRKSNEKYAFGVFFMIFFAFPHQFICYTLNTIKFDIFKTEKHIFEKF